MITPPKLEFIFAQALRAAISGLTPTYTFRFHNHAPIRFIPTCGEPYGIPLRADSSSQLATELDNNINKSGRHSLSLSGVPVVIPMEFVAKGERSIIDRFIRCCPAYREIFGNGNPRSPCLLDKMDTVLTSVGTLERPWRMCGIELCETGGIDREQFQKIVLGDIGGVLLHKSENPNATEIKQMTEIESLWTGIRYSDYIELAKRADHNHVGIIVLAIGANKAKIIHRCVKRGLVNHLICDEALAWGLCKETGSAAPVEIQTLR